MDVSRLLWPLVAAALAVVAFGFGAPSANAAADFPPGPSVTDYPPGPSVADFPPGPSVTDYPPGPTTIEAVI